ncbi:MAG: hypothetical protein IJ583_06210 [Firmicutes bacterium]|nr:hypothetical protein [Bacillota bacterium]
MMKEYIKPEMKKTVFSNEDIVTASVGGINIENFDMKMLTLDESFTGIQYYD